METIHTNLVLKEFAELFFPENKDDLEGFWFYTTRSSDLEGVIKICTFVTSELHPNKLDIHSFTEDKITTLTIHLVAIVNLDMKAIPKEEILQQVVAAGFIVRSIGWRLANVLKEQDYELARSIFTTFEIKLKDQVEKNSQMVARFIEEIGLDRLISTLFPTQIEQEFQKVGPLQHFTWLGSLRERDELARILKINHNWIKSQASFIRAFPTIDEPAPSEPATWVGSDEALVYLLYLLNKKEPQRLVKPNSGKGIWLIAYTSFINDKGEIYYKSFPKKLNQIKNKPDNYSLIINKLGNVIDEVRGIITE